MARGRGIQEVLVTEAIKTELAALGRDLTVVQEALRPSEAADRLALHISRVVARVLRDTNDEDDLARAIAKARQISVELGVPEEAPIEPGRVLQAILAPRPDGTSEVIDRPLIPLLDTTLLTNAPGEPRVGSQLLAEIHSADRIDVVMAFIRMSGIRPLLDALGRHCQAGRALR